MRDLRESTIGGYKSIKEGNTGTRDTGGRVLSKRVETEGGEGVRPVRVLDMLCPFLSVGVSRAVLAPPPRSLERWTLDLMARPEGGGREGAGLSALWQVWESASLVPFPPPSSVVRGTSPYGPVWGGPGGPRWLGQVILGLRGLV